MIEKTERQSGSMSFNPQSYLAQIDGQRILVHRIDATAHHISKGGSVGRGSRRLIPGSHNRQLSGYMSRCSEQEVT